MESKSTKGLLKNYRLFRLTIACLLVMSAAAWSKPAAAPDAANEDVLKLWSTNECFYWFARPDPAAGPLSITLNGSPPDPKLLRINDYKGFIHLCVRLKHETNTLVIIQGGKKLFEAEIFFAPSYENAIVPEDFLPVLHHTKELEEPCTPCHRMAVEAGDRKPQNPAASICYPCHQQEFKDITHPHKPGAPAWIWDCLECHQAEPMEHEFSPDQQVKYAIAEGAEVGPLCYRCHTKEGTQFANYRYIHGPIGTKRCNMCHDPHGSKAAKIMRQDISRLCIDCHEKKKMLAQPAVHKVVTKDGCTACHDPHGSDYPLLLKMAVNPLCLKCHPEISKKVDHPIIGHPVSGPKDPQNEEKKFTCVSCHNPHASENETLLPERDLMMLCANCHKM